MPRMTAQEIQEVNGWSEPPDQAFVDSLAQFDDEELETGIVKIRGQPIALKVPTSFTIPEQLAAALAQREADLQALLAPISPMAQTATVSSK